MSKTVDEFWMVWNEGHGRPTYKHPEFEQARDEAKRLAARYPGNDFIVLKAVGGCHMPSPGPQPIIIDDGIPF